jgi:hypothetical protein
MSPTFAHGAAVTVYVRTKTGEDGDGNDLYTAVPTKLDHVVIWPAGASEQVQGQDMTTTGATALLPVGTDVDAIDFLVDAAGDAYEVNGTPDAYVSPFTGLDPGVFVNLQRVF